MGDLSENFSRSEFACKCGCGFDTVDAGLVAALEEIRRHFDRPTTISSACRCEPHNKAVGGSVGSQHLRGRAADIDVHGTPTGIVADVAERLGLGGVGRYDSFTHVDTRHGKARWGGTAP